MTSAAAASLAEAVSILCETGERGCGAAKAQSLQVEAAIVHVYVTRMREDWADSVSSMSRPIRLSEQVAKPNQRFLRPT